MARWHITLLAAATFVLNSCQQQGTVVEVPGPNFNGPIISSPCAPSARSPSDAGSSSRQGQSRTYSNHSNLPKGWVPTAQARPWRWIVIHHSATPTGGAAYFDRLHRDKGWDELGYHFVVGNGTQTGNGQIEVGPRWPKQKWGAHTKTPDNRFNDFGIGICLVGNFDLTRPTDAQVKSVSRLVAYLMRTYHIPPDHVLGHGDCKPTDCPGRYMNVATVRRMACQMLADSGQDATPDVRTAIVDVPELVGGKPQ